MSEILDRNTIKALSVEQRQDIMKMLAKRPYTASEIAKIAGKHVTTVAQHLSVLENSGLVKKKDSQNKWVYYTLTDRGERLFKPQYYTWVVVLSLSIVLMSIGMLRLVSPIGFPMETSAPMPLFETVENPTEKIMEAPPIDSNAPLMGSTIEDISETEIESKISPEIVSETERLQQTAIPVGPDMIAFGLIAMGMFGLVYVVYRSKLMTSRWNR